MTNLIDSLYMNGILVIAEDGSVTSGGVAVVTTTGTQTLTNKTLTNPNILSNQASHNYAAGTTAWTLSATEKLANTLIVTNASGAADIIAPSEARRYAVVNTSGQAITIKKTAGTGVTIANTKTAIVEYVGSDYIRITADA